MHFKGIISFHAHQDTMRKVPLLTLLQMRELRRRGGLEMQTLRHLHCEVVTKVKIPNTSQSYVAN